jgi:hypothetical protein
MKTLLSIDRSSGRIADGEGSVVFDPNVGPRSVALSPNAIRSMFEATGEDGVKISVSYVESGGGDLSFFADHAQFGTSWDDWTEQKERARVAWLAEFLKSCGTPVGSYPWGKVEAMYDPKGGEGMATISYAAQQTAARDRVKKRGA